MAKQTFTAGQVLTATQMNNLQANDYNWTTSAQTASYVLVAANAGQTVTMTNAGATTITVNTGLFTAGDRVNILNLGAGTCTITAGTATVNTAGSLALPQYASGTLWFSSASAAIFIPDDRTTTSGLNLISTTAPSAAATVTLDNVFSSTYQHYLVTFNFSGGTTEEIRLQFRYGTTTQAASYFSAFNVSQYSGATGILNVNGGSYIAIANDIDRATGQFFITGVGTSSQAQLTGQTWIKNIGEAYSGGGYVNSTQTYTGFIFTNSAASSIFTGRVSVYGLALS